MTTPCALITSCASLKASELVKSRLCLLLKFFTELLGMRNVGVVWRTLGYGDYTTPNVPPHRFLFMHMFSTHSFDDSSTLLPQFQNSVIM
jgi:hypothetical protein